MFDFKAAHKVIPQLYLLRIVVAKFLVFELLHQGFQIFFGVLETLLVDAVHNGAQAVHRAGIFHDFTVKIDLLPR